MKRRLALVLLILFVVAAAVLGILVWRLSAQVNLAGMMGGGQLAELQVPPGFELTVFVKGLEEPRFIAFGEDGVLYVAERGADRIVRLPDTDGDGIADLVAVFAADVRAPHSLVQHEGSWFVGVPTGVVRLDDQDHDGLAEARQLVIDDYPTGGHNTRTVLFLPDGRMVVSVGSSCNVCLEGDPRRAAILIYEGADGTGERVFASGLRNAVGLALQPGTGLLWATNNGRDLLGDDLPPDTIELVVEGGDYGWPRCHSGRILDPDFGQQGACDHVYAPQLELPAHSAPLGLAFYDGEQFPTDYDGDLFVAYHGSWNRSVPTGYKVVRLHFDGKAPTGVVEDFAMGWLDPDSQQVSGRPVGLAVGPDGSLFVSDDKAGIIYRIRYQPQ